MIRKFFITAAAVAGVFAAGALTAPRADAMPLGVPAGAVDQIDMTNNVALCFYIDGWNGPGMYQCGYRLRRGYGWHGRRHAPPPRMHRHVAPRHGHSHSHRSGGSHHRR
jgi:hypothetical protein